MSQRSVRSAKRPIIRHSEKPTPIPNKKDLRTRYNDGDIDWMQQVIEEGFLKGTDTIQVIGILQLSINSLEYADRVEAELMPKAGYQRNIKICGGVETWRNHKLKNKAEFYVWRESVNRIAALIWVLVDNNDTPYPTRAELLVQ